MSLIVGPDSSREKKKPLTSRTHDPSPIFLFTCLHNTFFLGLIVSVNLFLYLHTFFAAIGSSLKRYSARIKRKREALAECHEKEII